MSYTENGYTKLEAFRENGYVVLDRYDQAADPQEWRDIEFVDWKSSGETRFAPLASAYGDLECDGFWNHTPPKTDKDGVWVPANADKAPRLVGPRRSRARTSAAAGSSSCCRTCTARRCTTSTATTTTGSTPRAPAGSCAASSTSPTTPTR